MIKIKYIIMNIQQILILIILKDVIMKVSIIAMNVIQIIFVSIVNQVMKKLMEVKYVMSFQIYIIVIMVNINHALNIQKSKIVIDVELIQEILNVFNA